MYKRFDDLDDAQVEREVKNWDKVQCRICGNTVSMLEADLLRDNSGFVHHKGQCPMEKRITNESPIRTFRI